MSQINDRILVLATGNPAKVKELNALLQREGWQVRSLKDVAGDSAIDETGSTLYENAEIKARFVRKLTGLPALADDTGLEVDALDGRPGVYSARFAGPGADDAQNRKNLLAKMEHITDPVQRTARFRTVLAFIARDEIRFYEGICNGMILTEERGEGGFGYDPVFLPDGMKKSFAEIEADEKNRISHRGRALQKFLDDLRKTWNHP